MVTTYQGTSPRIPFTVVVTGSEWGFTQMAIHIEGILDHNGDKDAMVLHCSVREGGDWRREVKRAMSAAHQAVWQVQGTTHHNAKLTDAVKDAFQLGLYEEVKKEEVHA
jgi:hypothetical protein